MAARRPTPRFAPPRRRGDRTSGAPPSKKEAKTGKTDSSALRPQNDREETYCSLLFTPSVRWSRTAPPSRGSYDSAPGHCAPHKEAPGSVPHVILSEAKNPHPSSLAPSLRELSPKVTEGVFPSRTRTGETDSSALRPQNDREERRCSILFTPSVWWSRTAPPSRGSYDSAPGHCAPHKEAPGSVPHVILSEAKNPHPSSLAPSLRELSPKVTEGVFPSRTRMGRRILRPAASE